MYLNFINVLRSNEPYIEVKWIIPHSMLVKIALITLHCIDSVSMLVINSPVISIKLFTALFWQVIKNQSVLTKWYNCLEVKVDYPTSFATESVISLCFVYDKHHFHLEVWGKVGYPTFQISFLPFQFLFMFIYIFM